MVATQAMVEAIGSVKVDDEADFTKAVFAQLLASAQAILDADNPGLSAALYDLAQAYMVMHLY